MPSPEIKAAIPSLVEYMGLSGKRALVTGATGGIGQVICARLSEFECNLVLPRRDELDLSDISSIMGYIERHNRDPINFIVHSAALNPAIPTFREMGPEQIEQVIRVNETAPLLLTRGLTEYMKEMREGRVVFISSIWGQMGRAARTVYSTTKFALEGEVRSLAQELGPYNILVNSICPGFVDTPMTHRNLSQQQIEALLTRVPLGRLAQPEEIADLVVFLLSKRSTYVSGASIPIDGAFLA